MTRFIPKEKMSKKARGELDRRQRRTWPVPPVTKTFASKKDYNRKRKPCDLRDDGSQGFRFRKKRGAAPCLLIERDQTTACLFAKKETENRPNVIKIRHRKESWSSKKVPVSFFIKKFQKKG